MSFDGVKYWVKRILTRPRTIWKASRNVGLICALTLVRIRFGTREKLYQLRVPQWPHPIYVRGGSSTDTTVLYEILVTKEYDEFVAGLGSPRFVIDGGANVGFFSLYFLSRYPESHIVAIEPDPDTVAVCRKNLAPYSDRVTVVQGAIWGQSGKLRLEATGEDWNHKTKAPGEGELGSVEAFTMPSLIARGGGAGVDLLKLDVEGAESEIFVANAKEWLPSVANIVVELHNPECHERFFSAMEPFQYEERGRDSASAPRGPNSPLVYCCRNIRPRVPGSDASAESDRALSRLP